MLTPRQALWTVVGLLGGLLAVVVIVAIVVSAARSTQIRATQNSNTQLLENTQRTLRIVEDCTTPGSPCQERGQRQMRAAITDINRVSIIAAACASGPREQSVEQIQSCVIRRLARGDR